MTEPPPSWAVTTGVAERCVSVGGHGKPSGQPRALVGGMALASQSDRIDTPEQTPQSLRFLGDARVDEAVGGASRLAVDDGENLNPTFEGSHAQNYHNPVRRSVAAPRLGVAFTCVGERLLLTLLLSVRQNVSQARLAAHKSSKKLAEVASGGTDSYVVAYLGKVGDKRTQVARTESVLASEDNGLGRNPVWSVESCNSIGGLVDNVLHITPAANDIHLTLEVWDSDIGRDDLLGGRTLLLAEMRQKLAQLSGTATMHIQLYDGDRKQGFECGHDAGVLQVCASYEGIPADGQRVIDPSGSTIRIEVQAAVDLRPDTPAIRDLTTFADWQNTIRMAAGLGVYMCIFTVYFGWFFSAYVCTAAGNIECVNTTGGMEYPVELGHPIVDAVLFILGSVTTVGWGNQPVNLVHPPDDVSNSEFWFAFTKILVSFQVIIGIVLIGLLIGSMGDSLRGWFRKYNEMVYAGLARTPLVETPPVGEKLQLQVDYKGCAGSAEPVHIALFMLCFVFLVGSLSFAFLDDMTFLDAWYLTVVTVSTVGYGDLAPTSASSKLFACFFVPLGVAFVASAIDTISAKVSAAREAELEVFVLGQFGERDSLESNDLTSFDFEELQRATQLEYGAPMSRNDFRLAMLLRLGRVEHEDMAMIDKVFSDLDKDGSGVIVQDEVIGEQECAMTRRIERLREAWAAESKLGEGGDALGTAPVDET